jgi:CHAT domain-containing protein/tetratricopeptide (TPR) repeat protein
MEQNLDKIDEIERLAEESFSKGDYRKSEILFIKLMEIIRSSLGEDHPSYAASLNNLAIVYESIGDYKNAEKLHKESLKIIRSSLGKDDPDYARSLGNLANVYESMGEYSKAEKLHKESLKIIRRSLGEDHPSYAASLNNLGVVYQSMGEYSKAEKLHEEALAIRSKSLGEDHPDYAASLNNLANVYESIGDYKNAEKLQKGSLEITLRSLGEDHPDYARSLSNLANVYELIGDYKEAEKLHKKALGIIGRSLGKNHSDYATSLTLLAGVYRSIGEYSKAEKLHEEALAIRSKSLGKDHPDYASSLNNLAEIYGSIGNYKKAKRSFMEAIEIQRKTLGKDHPDYASSLNNIALIYDSIGNLKEAERLFKEALKIILKSLGEEHPDTSNLISNLAFVYCVDNRIDDAFDFIKNAIEIDDKVIRNIFSMADEKQKLAYLGKIRGRLDILLSVVLANRSSSSIKFAFDTVLRRKGIVAELLAVQREQLLAEKNPHLRSKFEELSRIRNMMIMRYQKEKTSRDWLRMQKEIEKLDERRESLERELSRRIPEYLIERRIATADAAAVSKLLRNGSVLIEFVRFYKVGIKSTESRNKSLSEEGPRYSAFICRKDVPNKLEMIDLGDAKSIDCAIADLRNDIIGGAESEQDSSISMIDCLKTRLENLILKKLEPSFKGCKEVIICPDGQLNLLPFEILRCEDGKMLIDDYTVSYLCTGRDLLRVRRNIKKQHGSSKVIANPDFDLTVNSKGKKEKEETHYNRSREFDRGKHIVHELPATNFEGEFIAGMLAVRPVMRGNALEGKIRKMQSPKILHIATHGFFFDDDDWSVLRQNSSRLEFSSNLERLAIKMENPLLRSGLTLAGYNTYQRGGNLPPEAEDGALTAEDVSEMDLSGTELVVLSACGTGLGDVRAGEGVFGLRRTFVIAGAKTLIVSLWPVDDLATMLLMNRFYRNLLRRKMPKAKSLRDAQLYLRDSTGKDIAEIISSDKAMRKHFDTLTYNAHEAEKPFFDFRYWGAFICIGDPGPLS